MIENRLHHVAAQTFIRVSDAFERAKPKLKLPYKGPLISLASVYRKSLKNIAFIGVTGSCGKTTTKDLIHAALSQRFRGCKSYDSSNGLYAIARNVLSLRPSSRYCVQELGASGPGSLDKLLRVFRPSIGVVLNIGSDHFPAFPTLEATAQEKGKLVEALPPTGTAVLNADDPYVLSLASRCKGDVVTFGATNDALVRAANVTSAWPERLSFRVSYQGQDYPVRTRLCGAHWVSSVLAALTTALVMEVPIDAAIKGIEEIDPWLGRMQPVEIENGITFIRDDWKGVYWSVPFALDFLRSARAPRKIAIIGTTLRYYRGTSTNRYKSVARDALEVADYVLFVGKDADSALEITGVEEGRLRAFTAVKDADDFLRRFLQKDDLVLIKSGNTDHLARLVLARQRKVACWRMDCGRKLIMCDRCRLLGVG